MFLELIHGLFITYTEFRLSTTFIPIIIVMYIYNWYHSHIQAFIMCTSTDCNVNGAFPLPSLAPLADSFCSLFDPLLLTWNPPSCDRIRPPRSQAACKLTPPDPPSPQTLPFQIPRTQITQRLTKSTSR
jgi:hypothetical protein